MEWNGNGVHSILSFTISAILHFAAFGFMLMIIIEIDEGSA